MYLFPLILCTRYGKRHNQIIMKAVKNPYNANIKPDRRVIQLDNLICTSVPIFNNPPHTVYKIKFNGTFAVVCFHV